MCLFLYKITMQNLFILAIIFAISVAAFCQVEEDEEPEDDVKTILKALLTTQNEILNKLEEQRQAMITLHRCCNDRKDQITVFKNMFQTDECEAGTHECSDNAECTDSLVLYQCECHAGYSGDGFACQDIDECRTGIALCSMEEVCYNLPGTYMCGCGQGFQDDGVTCDDIDECTANPFICGEHASCTNIPGSYSCSCQKGFRRRKDNTCQDVDECKGNLTICGEYGRCNNVPGSYDCTCEKGFRKTDGDMCQDIDECKSANGCQTEAVCVNTPGSYYCHCGSPYTTDGRICDTRICEPPFSMVDDVGCVQLVKQNLTWNRANELCQNLGGRLYQGGSPALYKKIAKQLYGQNDYSDHFWIGIRDSKWVSSEHPVPDDFWKKGTLDLGTSGCGSLRRMRPFKMIHHTLPRPHFRDCVLLTSTKELRHINQPIISEHVTILGVAK